MTDETKMTATDELDPKQVREKAGLDMARMAALLGMSPRGYSEWEAGYRSPGGPAFRLLALIEADPRDMTDRLAAL